MIFAHPGWLPAAAVALGVMLWVWHRYDARRRAALDELLAPHLKAQLTRSFSNSRRNIRRSLFAASVVLLLVALARPQAGFRWEQVKRRGNDIVFAVDTSRSMLTPDVKPNRLARAKLAIDDFVSLLNGDAVGLVAFAGSAFLQTPITLDYGAFHDSLNALDTNIIPRGGTDITSAIQEAQAALQRRPGSDKVLILVTDGEDLEGDSLAAAKAAAQQVGLKIYTVGVGSANGDLIPLPADQGGGFLKDSEGRLVKSRLDEPALKALAAVTGGFYAPLGAEGQGLDTIYREALAPLAKHDLESRSQKIYTERYQWPLAASLALLLCSLMVGTRRRLPSPRPVSEDKRLFGRVAAPAAAAMLALVWLLPMHSAHASPTSAAKAYAQGNFTAAERDYSAAAQRNPQQPLLQYDAGTAAYKAGQFPQAAQAFQASVNAAQSGSAKRLAEQEDAYYNLGNTLYREGQKTEQGDTSATIQTWTQSVKAYDAALQLRTNDADSKFNRDLVNRKLAALKKKQSEQKQSKPQSQPKSGAQQQQGQSKNNSPQSKGGQPHGGQPKPQPNGQPQPSQQASAQQAPGSKPEGTQGTQPQQPGQSAQQPGQSAQQQRQSAQRAGQSAQQSEQAADERRAPGEMSRDEARELLDSVKKDDRHAPAAPVARNGGTITPPDEPLRNW